MKTTSIARIIPLLSAVLFSSPLERKLFRADRALTSPSVGAPREIADSFTRDQKPSVAGLYVHKEYKTQHNGVTHIVYRQRFQGLDIHGAEWVVNIDRDGQVLNAGGQLHDAPEAGVRPPSPLNMRRAAGAAARAVNPVLAAEATISQAGLNHRAELRFSTGGAMGDITGRPVWFAIRGALQPAWEFVVTDADGISTYQTVIEAETDRVLAKHAMTMFQAPRGLVFTGISPQPPVRFGFASLDPPPYVDREFMPFPSPWVANGETSGNNTITGLNPLGVAFLQNPVTAKAPNLDFQFPLVHGSNPPPPTAFPSAATTNLFYWVNRSHDLFHAIGFDEAAGNYQQYNFGRGGIEGDRLFAYAHYGTQATTGLAAINNAFYTTRSIDDGEAAMIAMYVTLNNGQFADGSLASDVIIHEYTHGVSLRLVRQLSSFQGSSMGEAFSDFFSLEFLVPEGAPLDGSYPVAEYWGRRFGQGIRTRPFSTNLDKTESGYRRSSLL